ncbi:MAG TPA: MoaD/ThiS family protein, partial [Burkholderiales bacterium]|nr:MoaD/ThiS family protein [Burkholderiales bacterium]
GQSALLFLFGVIFLKIRYFARLREAFGESEEISLREETEVRRIVEFLKGRGGQWSEQLSRPYRVAVNAKMAEMDATVSDDDELAIFPPVTGG